MTHTPNTPVIHFTRGAHGETSFAQAARYLHPTRQNRQGLQYHQLLIVPANTRVEAPTGAFVIANTEGTQMWWDELSKGLE